MTDVKELLVFHEVINSIKHKERRGWKLRGVQGVRDTIASHSFAASLLGWLRAKEYGMDQSKIIKLLLMHDLIMSFMPDVTPVDDDFEQKKKMEQEASEELFQAMPLSIRDEIKELFLEYQEQKTPEAVFARECDKLDTLLQAYYYERITGNSMYKEFLDQKKPLFRTRAGKELLAQLESLISQNHK